jgi:uncharacterized membrane protein
MVTRKHRLAQHVDEERIARAIREAEKMTSGKILLAVSDPTRGHVMEAAKRAFTRLRMHQTHHRNAVLFFVVPSAREFAVYGDAAIHEKLGQTFWDRLAASMSERIKAQDLSAGIVHGVEQVGRELAAHFPKPPSEKTL